MIELNVQTILQPRMIPYVRATTPCTLINIFVYKKKKKKTCNISKYCLTQ